MGVEVSIRLQHDVNRENSKASQPRPGAAPTRAAKSNRSRTNAPSVHDPGGRRSAGETPWDECVEQAIPSSHDLAESFLQSEPKEEQEELQAAITSQTQYMQESVTSVRDSDVGTGVPGGYSLPSFIAGTLKGMGDRLAISISDVTLTAEMNISQETNTKETAGAEAESIKMMIKMSELVLPGLKPKDNEPEVREGKREIVMQQLRLFCLSDPEAFSQYTHSPTPSSPRVVRSKSKHSSGASATLSDSPSESDPKAASPPGSDAQVNADGHESLVLQQSQGQQEFMNEFVEDNDLNDSSTFRGYFESDTFDDQLSGSSSDSLPAFASASGSEVPPSGSVAHSHHALPFYASSSRQDISDDAEATEKGEPADNIDNRGHAEMLAQTGHIDDHTAQHASPEDLAESKIFSHEEAESMYMSAISNGLSSTQQPSAMPGGWDWSEQNATDTHSLPSVHADSNSNDMSGVLEAQLTMGDDTISSAQTSRGSDVEQGVHEETSNPRPVESDETPFVAKQLLEISRLSVWFSLNHNDPVQAASLVKDAPDVGNPQVSESENVPLLNYSQYSDMSQSTARSEKHWTGATRQRPNLAGKTGTRQESQEAIEVEIYDLNAQFDIAIVKLMSATAKEVIKTLDSAKDHTTPNAVSGSTPRLIVAVRLDSAKIQFREHVAESDDIQSIPCDPHRSFMDDQKEDMLLDLSLTTLDYSSISSASDAQQRLSVSRLCLSHSTGELVSFLHNIKMQGSVKDIDSLNQDDLLARVNSNADVHQVDVQVKPIHIRLELLKLDEILSRSGGLSSLLDLGNSIVSTGTVRSSPRKPDITKPRPRTVRFQTTPLDSASFDQPSVSSGKINVRVAGAFVDVIGSTCGVKFQSSAIKTVYRREGLGVVIDRAKVEGPIFSGQVENADVNVRLKTIRIEYLPIPGEKDLDRLISLLTPSNDRYGEDDDIMVDTLLRQRRQGGVLRLNVDEIESSLNGLGYTSDLEKLVGELGKLSTVAKYLPEDDRPGVLTFGLIKRLDCRLIPDKAMGELRLTADVLEGAHVSVPSLMAAQIVALNLTLNDKETLLGNVLPPSSLEPLSQPPMIMCRFIADEMEPTIKLKFCNACLEYKVSTLMAFLSFSTRSNISSPSSDAADQSYVSPAFSTSSSGYDSAANLARRAKVAVAIRDSAIGLNPSGMSSKALVVLTDAHLVSSLENKKENAASVSIKKASIMVTNDIGNLGSGSRNVDHNVYFDENQQVQQLSKYGYVSVSTISSASAIMKFSGGRHGAEQTVDVELRNNLLVMESCADSTQTLLSIFSNLSPPAPPAKKSKYRTEIVPIEDMLASFTGDAYVTEAGPDTGRRTTAEAEPDEDGAEHRDLEYVSDFFPPESDEDADDSDQMAESYIDSELDDLSVSGSVFVAPVVVDAPAVVAPPDANMVHSVLDFKEDYFVPESVVGGTAHRWNSSQNTYGLPNDKKIQKSPLKVRVRDVHVIWNLFDGYDWQSTRDTISEAVNEIEARASARRPRSNSRLSPGTEDEEESVIGDFLFNSIYIGIPANKDPRELANAINHGIDDASETGSYATTTTVTGSTARHQQSSQVRRKKLRLMRSKAHKMTFELEGVSADFLVSPAGSGEIESSLDVRVRNLTVFDHLPTSTWRKFATYMQDAGVRETDTNMLHLEILNVNPIADLAASEMILKVTVLPLRLHVDQDALDFMSRFFEFKDESAPASSSTPSAPPFLQRVEINPIKVRLDFKPKRVDYGGIRSGRTTEFMNFFILDRADMVLRRIILYGVSGFDRMGIMLNNIWMPDVKRNQLPGILAGLAPFRPLVDVGSGIKDLVVVPMREYKKDGRIVRSIQKGALAFAKTTTTELVILGAKLALGTQTVLQDAETMLAPDPTNGKWDDADVDEDSKKQISLYADQPIGVVQGLRGAYASLERDLLLARDAIIAVPGEVMASSSASGAARAVLRQTPTIILRPAIGATKAVGQTLLGAGNSLNRDNYRRMEEVSFDLGQHRSYKSSLTSSCRNTRDTNKLHAFDSKASVPSSERSSHWRALLGRGAVLGISVCAFT